MRKLLSSCSWPPFLASLLRTPDRLYRTWICYNVPLDVFKHEGGDSPPLTRLSRAELLSLFDHWGKPEASEQGLVCCQPVTFCRHTPHQERTWGTIGNERQLSCRCYKTNSSFFLHSSSSHICPRIGVPRRNDCEYMCVLTKNLNIVIDSRQHLPEAPLTIKAPFKLGGLRSILRAGVCPATVLALYCDRNLFVVMQTAPSKKEKKRENRTNLKSRKENTTEVPSIWCTTTISTYTLVDRVVIPRSFHLVCEIHNKNRPPVRKSHPPPPNVTVNSPPTLLSWGGGDKTRNTSLKWTKESFFK